MLKRGSRRLARWPLWRTGMCTTALHPSPLRCADFPYQIPSQTWSFQTWSFCCLSSKGQDPAKIPAEMLVCLTCGSRSECCIFKTSSKAAEYQQTTLRVTCACIRSSKHVRHPNVSAMWASPSYAIAAGVSGVGHERHQVTGGTAACEDPLWGAQDPASCRLHSSSTPGTSQ